MLMTVVTEALGVSYDGWGTHVEKYMAWIPRRANAAEGVATRQSAGGVNHVGDEQPKHPSEADAELERQIRAERKFTLTEAIGRLAGPGAMKGVSPIDRKRQAEAEIQRYLEQHLVDSAGALSGVLLRLVGESEVLLRGSERPLTALADFVRLVLDSEYALKELVREADVEWGRVFDERPHFDRDGRPPAPDDPYTLESVRTALTQLVDGLTAGDE
jgi:hypothetical protein